MKHMSSLLLAIILPIMALTSCRTDNATQRSLTILSWNVWHGGHSKAYGQQACQATTDILRHSGADVIVMVETYGAAPMVADSLRFYHRPLSDNLSIYSRYPIVRTLTFPDSISTFNFAGVEIDVDGTIVRVFDTWLHYLPDTRLVPVSQPEDSILRWENQGTRDDEIRTILATIRPMILQADSIPIIMAGDFNSHSHLDWTDATRSLHNHGGAAVNWTVSRLMADAGFLDSYRVINPDPAALPGTTWLADNDSIPSPTRADRIDYIYYMGRRLTPVSSQSFDVDVAQTLQFRDRQFFYPSDHGFVITRFNLD